LWRPSGKFALRHYCFFCLTLLLLQGDHHVKNRQGKQRQKGAGEQAAAVADLVIIECECRKIDRW